MYFKYVFQLLYNAPCIPAGLLAYQRRNYVLSATGYSRLQNAVKVTRVKPQRIDQQSCSTLVLDG